MSWQVCYKATGQKCPNALFKTTGQRYYNQPFTKDQEAEKKI